MKISNSSTLGKAQYILSQVKKKYRDYQNLISFFLHKVFSLSLSPFFFFCLILNRKTLVLIFCWVFVCLNIRHQDYKKTPVFKPQGEYDMNLNNL